MSAGLPPQAFVDAVDVDLIGVMNLIHASMKHLTGQQLRVDAGGLLKIKPWSGP